MTPLAIRIERRFGEQELHPGLPVSIRRVDRDGRLFGPAEEVLAPLSDHLTKRLELDAGRYEARVVMPSGELREAQVILEGEQEGVLVLASSPLLDAAMGGGWPWAERHRARLLKGDNAYMPFRVGEDSARLGPNIHDLYRGYAFSGKSWFSWHDWLDDRASGFSPSGAPPLHLRCDGPVDGLRVEAVDQDRRLGSLEIVAQPSRAWQPPREAWDHRPFLSVQHEGGLRITSLPFPWEQDRPEAPAAPLLRIDWASEPNRLSWKATLLDHEYGGLLDYLNAGQVGRASQVLRGIAYEALFHKIRNPLAAALGGYVLMATDTVPKEEDWPQWLENLTNWFPHVPDGPILRARWLLEHSRSLEGLDAARTHLLSAFDRGIPFFSAGVTWLIEGLRTLAVDDETCADRLQIVRGVARSMDLTQPFATFDLKRPVGQLDLDVNGLDWGRLPTASAIGLEGVDYARSFGRLSSSFGLPLLATGALLPLRRETEEE